MARFSSERDRRVYEGALGSSPAHHMIGDATRCQFEARVDFGSGGAIVTEDGRGVVRVTYYRSTRALKASWMDTVYAHADCCLYAAAAA